MIQMQKIWRLLSGAILLLLAALGVLVFVERHWFKGKNTVLVENGVKYLTSAIEVFYRNYNRLPGSPDARGVLNLDALWRDLGPREDVNESPTFLYVSSGRNWKEKGRFVDAWTRDYIITATNLLHERTTWVFVRSCGLDGMPNTSDDIEQGIELRGQVP